MARWSGYQIRFAKQHYRTKSHREIANTIGKTPEQVASWLERHGYIKSPNFTSTENLLIMELTPRAAHVYIPHKSLNAIKIQKCRLKKLSTLAK